MSQNDNFTGGFLAGTLIGGVLGGVMGVLLASRLTDETADKDSLRLAEDEASPQRRWSFPSSTDQNMEMARQGLEDKIAQLNDAIDDVRQQLYAHSLEVNGEEYRDADSQSSLSHHDNN